MGITEISGVCAYTGAAGSHTFGVPQKELCLQSTGSGGTSVLTAFPGMIPKGREGGNVLPRVACKEKQMDIQVKKDVPVLEVALTDRLDTATSPELDAVLKREITGDVQDLIIDLTDLEYISSAGLRVLLAAQKKMKGAGGSMRVMHPNEVVEEVFDVTGFSEILTIEK